MSSNTNPLFELLPAIHRLRDAEQGGPLRELLAVVAEQVAVLEEDLEQLYDDQFIETCADWTVPYVGDLIGYRSLHHKVPQLSAPRAEVANTIGYRRRKGTAAMLEQLAHDVTGWPAKVVEFFQLLATSQFMNHIRLHSPLTPDLRRWDLLESIDTPFDMQAHTVDTRRIASGEGQHNIPNVGIFLWRLAAFPLHGSPAVSLDAQRWFFSPLGCNTPLFTMDESEPTITHLANRLNVPAPISRRRLFESLADYYGAAKSLFVAGFAAADVRVCNLSDHAGGWAHVPPPGKVAIDPRLGRLAFGDAQPTPPSVSFHYGFSMPIGGGEYERASSFQQTSLPVLPVAAPALIQNAINGRAAGQTVEVSDNGRYPETLQLTVLPGEHFELRAANGRCPTVVLGGDFIISGGDEQAEVSLNGLLLLGGRIIVTGKLRLLRLQHCTLVPGLTLGPDGAPQHAGEPSLVIETGGLSVEVNRCLLGGIQCHEESRVAITSTIVDATDDSAVAFAGPGPVPAASPSPRGGTLWLQNCTVIGKVHARILELATNSIFVARTATGDGWQAPVLVQRKQIGCVRFTFVPASSRTPQRYRCQPDLEIATRTNAAAKAAQKKNQALTAAQRAAIARDVVGWLRPSFTSLSFGQPGYGQLRSRAPEQIRQGADDEAAMGAFHDLFEPQRLINLRVRLDEYLRVGLEAGIFPVT